MKKMFLGLFMAASVLATSCSDDDSENTKSSREIKYEVTGNFTGTLTTAYTTSSGGTTTSEITALPWDLEFTAQPSVPAVAFATSGSGGVAGQKIQVKVYQGGHEVSNTEGTADSSGIVSVSSPAVVF